MRIDDFISLRVQIKSSIQAAQALCHGDSELTTLISSTTSVAHPRTMPASRHTEPRVSVQSKAPRRAVACESCTQACASAFRDRFTSRRRASSRPPVERRSGHGPQAGDLYVKIAVSHGVGSARRSAVGLAETVAAEPSPVGEPSGDRKPRGKCHRVDLDARRQSAGRLTHFLAVAMKGIVSIGVSPNEICHSGY
jgi:hypothetical protein